MAAYVVNLSIEKGTDFEASFTVTGDDGDPLNLLYTTAFGSIKKHPTSERSHDFVVGITTSESSINVSMGRTVTSQLSSGRNCFDIFIQNNQLDFVSRVVTGTVIVEDTII
jgi:hypothetical protein